MSHSYHTLRRLSSGSTSWSARTRCRSGRCARRDGCLSPRSPLRTGTVDDEPMGLEARCTYYIHSVSVECGVVSCVCARSQAVCCGLSVCLCLHTSVSVCGAYPEPRDPSLLPKSKKQNVRARRRCAELVGRTSTHAALSGRAALPRRGTAPERLVASVCARVRQ